MPSNMAMKGGLSTGALTQHWCIMMYNQVGQHSGWRNTCLPCTWGNICREKTYRSYSYFALLWYLYLTSQDITERFLRPLKTHKWKKKLQVTIKSHYTDAVSLVTASVSMRLRLSFTRRRSSSLTGPSRSENAFKSGAICSRVTKRSKKQNDDSGFGLGEIGWLAKGK